MSSLSEETNKVGGLHIRPQNFLSVCMTARLHLSLEDYRPRSVDVGSVYLTDHGQALVLRKNISSQAVQETRTKQNQSEGIYLIPDQTTQMLKKMWGVFEGQKCYQIPMCALARSVGSVCPLHGKPSYQAQVTPAHHPWFRSIQDHHIRHIRFVPVVSVESCSNSHPIISSSPQLPLSFFHQLLALLLGVVVAYASPT